MSEDARKPWTIGQYVFMAALAAFLGAVFIAGGSDAGVVVGILLLAVAAGLGLVAAVAKGNQVGR
jgi:hypothetical protein